MTVNVAAARKFRLAKQPSLTISRATSRNFKCSPAHFIPRWRRLPFALARFPDLPSRGIQSNLRANTYDPLSGRLFLQGGKK
jgi:hypothetical protein